MTQLHAPQRQAPAGLAIASVCVAIVLTVVAAATAAASFPAVREFKDAIELTGTAANVFTVYDTLGLLLVPAIIAAWIVTCLWLRAARENTVFINPVARHARGSAWVWLGWVVPVVSLWFPYQVVRDVQAGSRHQLPRIDLTGWWGAWLIWAVGSRITAKIAASDDIDVVAMLPTFEVLTALALVAACVQWCRIVRGITADQQAALTPA